jgi:hypothetical protein
MTGKMIFIYDACQSGTFLSLLTPPSDKKKERILITGASDEAAYFLNNGGLSFSFQFWAHIYYGHELDDAFYFGSNMMTKYQTSLLDANGNGTPNEKDDKTVADKITIGMGYVTAPDIPLIQNICEAQTLEGEQNAMIWVSGLVSAKGIQRVWAIIMPPDYTPGSPDTPDTELPAIDLTDTEGYGVYQGTYGNFIQEGTYMITVYATDTDGIYSLPIETTVIQNKGTTPDISKGDINGDGEVNLTDAIIVLKIMTAQENLQGFQNLEGLTTSADVNSDDKIGPEEVIYVLQELAELR